MSIVFNHTAHRELWDWLANNPGQDKCDWPGWQDNGGEYAIVCGDCFACQTAIHALAGFFPACQVCPLDWSASSGMSKCTSSATDQNPEGLFTKWSIVTIQYLKLLDKSEQGDLALCEEHCREWARMIRDLPLNSAVIHKYNITVL